MMEANYVALVFASVALINILLLTRVFVLFRRKFSAQYAAAEKQLKMMNSSVLGMGLRILELEKKVVELREAQQDVSESHAEFSYSQARNLLAQGLSKEAVSASTGLSLSEVQLMDLVRTSGRAKSDELTETA